MAQEAAQGKKALYIPNELQAEIMGGDEALHVLRYSFKGREGRHIIRVNGDGTVLDFNLKEAGSEKFVFSSVDALLARLGAKYIPGKEGRLALAKLEEYVPAKVRQPVQRADAGVAWHGGGGSAGRSIAPKLFALPSPKKTKFFGTDDEFWDDGNRVLVYSTKKGTGSRVVRLIGDGGSGVGSVYDYNTQNEYPSLEALAHEIGATRSRLEAMDREKILRTKPPEGYAELNIARPPLQIQVRRRFFESPSSQPFADSVGVMTHFYEEDAKVRRAERRNEAAWCSSGVMAMFYAMLAEKGLSTNVYHHFGRPYEQMDAQPPSPGYIAVLREPMFEQQRIWAETNWDGTIANAAAWKALRAQLLPAPRGSILTVRNERTGTGIERGITHAMVCLGDGKYADVFGMRYREFDFSNMLELQKFFKGYGKEKLVLGQFTIQEDSRLFVPRFERFAPAVNQTFVVRDAYTEQDDAGALPERLSLSPVDFARRLSGKLNMPFEAIFPEVARQNMAKNFNFKQAVAHRSIDFIVTLRVPTFPGIVPDITFNLEGNPAKTPQSTAGRMSISRWWATSRFESKAEDISRYAKEMGIPAPITGALKTVLFNEYYSSLGKRVGLDVLYNIAYSLLPDRWVDNIADDVSERAGHGKKLPNSIGIFQVGVRQTIEYLDHLANRNALPAAKRVEAEVELAQLLSATGKEKGVRNVIENWNPALDAQKKREKVVGDILSSDRMQLYFAYLRFSLDLRSVVDRTRVEAESGSPVRIPSPEDVSFTAVFSYNKGISRTQAAVFQQNLCMLSQSPYVSMDLERISGSGFRIDGQLGPKTAEFCRELCMSIGMLDASVNGMALGQITSDAKLFESMFAEYGLPGAADSEQEKARQGAARKNIREFFLLVNEYLKYGGGNFVGPLSQENDAFLPFPCLSQQFCSANQELLTTARQNYFAFVE